MSDLDWISGDVWAMEEKRLQIFAQRAAEFEQRAASLPLPELKAAAVSLDRSPGQQLFELRGSTAVVPIAGVMVRRLPWWAQYFGADMTATPDVRAAVEQAAADPRVRTILLHIDSPGGEARGLVDLAEAIFEARKQKRVEAAIEGMGASAAYWMAAQAHAVTASPDAWVGSIGTYMVVIDSSKQAERAGVTVHVVRAGAHKGAGQPGAPVTAEQLAGLQQLVNAQTANFVAAIVRGRKTTNEQVAVLATGQVWLASDALKHGLVDRVEPIGKAFSRLAPREEGRRIMADVNQSAPDPAIAARAEAQTAERKRFSDLKAAFPKHQEFAIGQYESGATVDQARLAYSSVLERENEQLRAEASKAKSAASAASSATTQAPPSTTATPRGGDPGNAPTKDFMAAARERAKEIGCSVTDAMSYVSRTQPGLHASWIESQPKHNKRGSGESYERVNGVGAQV